MTAMFGASAAYHRGRWSPRNKRRMKALDHVMIFAFIFGSYVPPAVLLLGPRGRVRFLGGLLVVVVLGAVVKLRRLDRLGGAADAYYGVGTWWGLVIAGPAVRLFSGPQLLLAVAGIVLYSATATVLGSRRPDPAPATFGYHEVAHALTVLAAVAHYTLYWRAFG